MMRTLTVRGYLALIALVALVTLGAVVAGSARAAVESQDTPMTHHSVGTFDVAVTPADSEVVEAGLGLSRYTLAKTFNGGMTGQGVGQMLAGGPNATTGSYVALERFVGTLDGKEGAFLLAHRGDMGPDGFSLSITVVPNSGTGALTGIAGVFSLTIADGQHKYDLAYTLPE